MSLVLCVSILVLSGVRKFSGKWLPSLHAYFVIGYEKKYRLLPYCSSRWCFFGLWCLTIMYGVFFYSPWKSSSYYFYLVTTAYKAWCCLCNFVIFKLVLGHDVLTPKSITSYDIHEYARVFFYFVGSGWLLAVVNTSKDILEPPRLFRLYGTECHCTPCHAHGWM